MSDTIRDFRLPDLGEGLEEGEIAEWHVAVGDDIDLNATVASIETAKAIVDVPSPFGGTVVELVGEVGATLEVGEVFVRIDVGADGGGDDDGGSAGDDAGDDRADHPDDDHDETNLVPRSTGLDAESEPQPLVGYGNRGATTRRRRGAGASPEPDAATRIPSGDEASIGQAPEGRSGDGSGEPWGAGATSGPAVLAKPPVRKLARDLGVDLAAIAPGSGADGIVTRDDVRAGAATSLVADQAPTPVAAAPSGQGFGGAGGEKPVPGFRGRVPGEVEEVRGVRKRIIAKMSQSRREIPHALCRTDADVTELWQARKDLTAAARDDGLDVKVTPMALVMRATILALRRFPTLNATFDAETGQHGTIRLHEAIHLGVAVDTDRGLMVPVIHDAHAKSTVQLAAEAAALASRCRDGSVTPGDLTGGTFTVDNYGFFGNDDGNPIINHPEVGILGMGAIRERPWVVGGELAVRQVCSFTLAFDHRVADGGEAGRFTTYVADLCAAPTTMLLHL